MELIHKINNTIVEEPIGFDSLEVKISRGNYHGISAEVSVGTLEFYGSAHNLIRSAYDHDIDSILKYEVRTDTGILVYDGAIDLSTCSFQDSEYQSVSVNVGEIGTKTTFNNRSEVDVDLETTKTIDGSDMDPADWMNMVVPTKHLLYTCGEKQKENRVIVDTINNPREDWGEMWAGWYGESNYDTFFIPLNDVYASEFGSYNKAEGAMMFKFDDLHLANQQWSPGEDYEAKYGTGTTIHVDIDLKANVIINRKRWYIDLGNKRIGFSIVAQTTEGYRLATPYVLYNASELNEAGVKKDISAHLVGDIQGGTGLYYFLNIEVPSGLAPMLFNLEILKGSKVKLTMYDNLPSDDQESDFIPVHDALNVVTKAISENQLSVKSTWYGSQLSKWDKETAYGGGALKAITNGYKIRGLYSDGETERNMPISFRKLIESLDAIDCIGWGFVNEGGSQVIRVERWWWFYKNNTILTLDGANKIQRDVDASRIVTEFKIGYKKYATTEQYNSIDSIHGERTFTSKIKAVSSPLERTCEFVADNYAIEETRRARGKETEQTTYDESIFVFELIRDGSGIVGSEMVTFIGQSATNEENVGRPGELINAKISPRHMAARWRNYLFACNTHSDLRFTSGEINYQGKFGVIPAYAVDGRKIRYSLETESISNPQTENEDITNTHAIFCAETITFDYPLTIAQYNAVKNDPYGLVIVNGIPGWIQEMTYKVNDGLATFKLIPKYKG